MRALCIVEGKVTRQRRPCFTNTVIGPQINLFIFHRPPKALDKNVVAPGATAIHAHGDRVLQQQPSEGRTCELGTLIGVENFRPPYLASASSTASRQKSTSMVIDSLHESTRRLNQSTTAAR